MPGHMRNARGSDRLIRQISSELLGPFVWGPVPSHDVERRAGELIAEMGTTGNDSLELNGVPGVRARGAGGDGPRG